MSSRSSTVNGSPGLPSISIALSNAAAPPAVHSRFSSAACYFS
jgi:hypothetical protein